VAQREDDDTVDRGSDKVSPRVDDELKHETQGLVHGGHSTHAEEWKDPEPSGEDQPDVDRDPDGALSGGTPAGMTSEDVDRRSELASYLGRAPYPVVREQLIELALDHKAPDRVVDHVKALPAGRTFASVGEVWEALGGHVEHDRF
jgi:hypothetical protein